MRLEVIPANNAPNDKTSKIVPITHRRGNGRSGGEKISPLLKQDGKDYKLSVIEIPAFTTWTSRHSALQDDPDYKSTRDVKKLLTELQKDKIDGVVIDLRNNGGGSLQEATELTSLFIDKGPVVLVHRADKRVDVLEDENPGAFYEVRWRCWSTACPLRPRRFSLEPCKATTAP